MPVHNLKSKTKKGLFWSSIERFGTQGIQFLFGIILARLLSPEDYGIIAMPMIFLALAQVFIDSGFSSALTRKPDLKEVDLSTAFFFNIIIGVVCYISLFAASPWIAVFYKTPILENLLKVTALVTLFNPLCTVQQTLLTREINFKIQAVISVSAQLLTGIVGIYMAYSGYGVWALVISQTAASLLRVILFWTLGKWRPTTGWSKESFKYLWGFGSKMMAVGLIDTTYNNVYPLVIGKFYSASSLGNFTRAQNFSNIFSSNMTGVLQRVTFPVLSTIQNDDERLQSTYRKLLRLSAFVIFPLMTGLAGVASPMINILLGTKWSGCTILLQILCFSQMWYPIHAINLNLLAVKGRSDLFLRLEVIKKSLGVIIMIFTTMISVEWMCYGLIVLSLFALIINTYYTGKIIGVGFIVQMKDLSGTLITSLLMFVLILTINHYISSAYNQFVIDIIIGITFFAGITRIFKFQELEDTIYMLKNK